MGWLLIGLGMIEGVLKASRRRLLSHQRGWKRALVIAVWVAFGLHLAIEARRNDAADRAAKAWSW